MNKIITTLLFIFLATNAHAGYFVLHSGETITGKRASCGSVCSENPSAIRVTEAMFNATDASIHKVVDGTVVGMTQAEMDAIAQAEADAQALAVEEALDKFEVSNLELMTALIQRLNVRLTSNPITKTEMLQQIRDNR